MRVELANLNHCAVLFLSRADDNLCWCYYTQVSNAVDIKGGTTKCSKEVINMGKVLR